ncbi:MAG: hypothetical protein WAW90_00600, partial [Minisyncoccia bacterium]
LTDGELFTDCIKNAETIDDLIRGLRGINKDIIRPADKHVYNIGNVIELISSIKSPDSLFLRQVTETYGLRKKVKELLSKSEKAAEPAKPFAHVEEKVQSHEEPQFDGLKEGDDDHSGEDTPKGWRDRLRGLVVKFDAKEKIVGARDWMSEKGQRLGGYLKSRSGELEKMADKMQVEESFRWLGEKYNKLTFKQKIGVGIALGLGAVASSGVSMPIAFACMSGLAIQRAAGMASMFLRFEKGDTKEGRSEKEKKEWAILKAGVYTLGMGYAIKEGVELASNLEAVQEAKRYWLGNMLGHNVLDHHAVEDVKVVEPVKIKDAPKAVTDQLAAYEATHSGAPAGDATAVVSAPEVELPTVKASPGHGYEYMMKQMWKELQGKGLDPNDYAKDSDMYKLLTTDEGSVNKVVHQLAADPKHEFFHIDDGESVVIAPNAEMTIDADGQIHVDSNIKAPEGSSVTQAPDHPHTRFPLESAETSAPPEAGASVSAVLPAEDGVPHPGLADTPKEEWSRAPVGEHVDPTVVQTKEFTIESGLTIDPRAGHLFEDSEGKILAYGNNFEHRFNAAQDYARANPGTSVWVQAAEPYSSGFFKKLSPWMFEVKFDEKEGLMPIPVAPTYENMFGIPDPNTFTKQLDK